ncbi:hypothetical protein FHG87_015396 [Trinorchestia longiramus]|nr:hypothetical protein FHG87_015396 [Trinorchestia longiramus]
MKIIVIANTAIVDHYCHRQPSSSSPTIIVTVNHHRHRQPSSTPSIIIDTVNHHRHSQSPSSIIIVYTTLTWHNSCSYSTTPTTEQTKQKLTILSADRMSSNNIQTTKKCTYSTRHALQLYTFRRPAGKISIATKNQSSTELKIRVVCWQIDSWIGGNSADELKQEIPHRNQHLEVREIIKFGQYTHVFKIEFVTINTASHTLQHGILCEHVKIAPSQIPQKFIDILTRLLRCNPPDEDAEEMEPEVMEASGGQEEAQAIAVKPTDSTRAPDVKPKGLPQRQQKPVEQVAVRPASRYDVTIYAVDCNKRGKSEDELSLMVHQQQAKYHLGPKCTQAQDVVKFLLEYCKIKEFKETIVWAREQEFKKIRSGTQRTLERSGEGNKICREITL